MKHMNRAVWGALALAVLATVTSGARRAKGSSPDAAVAAPAAGALLDVNKATVDELEALPGLGRAKAAAIVADREANGPFGRIEDLGRVKGIGDKLQQKLAPLLRFGASSASASATTSPVGTAPALSPNDIGTPAVAPARAKAAPVTAETDEDPTGRVNVNLATPEELQALDKIGDGKARLIVAWREKKGPFRSMAELGSVPRLGRQAVSALQAFGTVRVDAAQVTEAQLVQLGVSPDGARTFVRHRRGHPLRASADVSRIPSFAESDATRLDGLLWFSPPTGK